MVPSIFQIKTKNQKIPTNKTPTSHPVFCRIITEFPVPR